MESLPRHLKAEIIVERVGESPARGSGYLIAPGWVLTANHVVVGASRIRVWFGAPDELRSEAGVAVEPARVVAAPQADLALLPVDSRIAPTGEPALLGRLDRESTVPVTAIAAGFPRFKLRSAPGRRDVLLRERHDAIGTIMPGSNTKTGTYELTSLNLQPDDDPEPLKHSPWEGMSGAAVWANGRLIGVVAQHHPREGTGSLTVCPIEALFRHSTAAQLANWQAALGPRFPNRAWDLWLVTPESFRHRAIERALEAARELAPAILESRESELSQLDAFAGSEEPWLWLQAAAFAGKTALVAWFASHAPAGVGIVSCFLRRTTGENTAGFALDTLNAQLAAWADRPGYVPAVYPSEKKREFPRLLADAARACTERGSRLLVLIDGADEYDTSATGLRLHDWLPDSGSLPPHAALLMTSRSGSDIGLPATHLLHNHLHAITPSEVAGKIENMARVELDQALADTSGIQYPLLGFLAAASRGLTNKDLSALLTRAGHKVYTAAINDTIRTSFDRMLIQSSDHEESNDRLNNFAHDTLLAAARQKFADDLPAFEGQLLDWCQHFKDHHWPKDTPVYALSQYPRHLVRAERREELFALVVDQEWYHRHTQVDPTGNSYLEGIDIIWTAAETVDEAQTKAAALTVGLGVEAHCALTSASVRNLSSGVSLSLMVALVGCHYWSERHAWRVASLNPDARERGHILAGLARHLKEPVLTMAVRDALRAISGVTDEFARVWLLKALAPYIPESMIGDALRLARSLPVRLSDDRNPRVAALAAVLPRVASLGRGREALEEALALMNEDDRARVLAQLGRQLPADLKQKALFAVRAMNFIDNRAEGLAGFAMDAGDGHAGLVHEALDAALSAKSTDARSWTLYLLTPLLPGDRFDEVLAMAEELEEGNRFRLLAALTARLGKLGQWRRALDIARRLKSEDVIWFVRALVAVAPSVPDPERIGVAHEMLSAAQAIPYEIAKVAPFLPEPLLRDAIAFARSIPHADMSTETLAVLLPRLAELGHFQEAFDLALAMSGSERASDEPRMSRTLSTLIPFLPEPLQSRACLEALREANRIDDCDDRMQTLGALAAFLSEADLRYVLELIRKIGGFAQARVLEDVAPELPDLLLLDALAVARDVSLAERFFGTVMSSPRAYALLALARRLPEPMRSESLQQAAEAINFIDSHTERTKANARLASLLPEPPQLPENVKQEAIEAACNVGAGYGRLSAVAALVPYVPSSVIDKVTNDIRDSDEQCSNHVRSIMEHIRTGRLWESDLIDILQNALASAERIEDPAKRAASMGLLVPHFSILLQRNASEILDERDWRKYQTRILESLGPVLESDQLPEALDIALSLSDDISSWCRALAALAPRLEKLPPADAYSIWRTALRGVSTGRRSNLFHHLMALLPVILKLGGSTEASRMASAIKVTGDWWP